MLMALLSAQPSPSIAPRVAPCHVGHHSTGLLPSTVSYRRLNCNQTLAAGPKRLRQRSKISDFSCLFPPLASRTLVAVAVVLPFASSSPEGSVDPDFLPESESFSSSSQESSDYKEPSDFKGDTLDVNLPRRSLLVLFTCDGCGTRTERTINRNAYERGTVFVQCAGCEAYHKLVDNLGLIVEYDLKNDSDRVSKQL